MSERDHALRQNAESTDRLRGIVGRLTDTDLERSLGGGWTVGFALVHLAFWDARQVFAVQSFARGDGFPSEDWMTNATLESIAPLFRADIAADMAVTAAERLDATLAKLSAEQHAALREAGFAYAIERWPHHEEHLAQIEEVLV